MKIDRALGVIGCALLLTTTARAASYTWDLTDQSKDYYANPASATPGIKMALKEAKAWFADKAHDGDLVTLQFGPGTYKFITPETIDEIPVLNVTDIAPGADAQGHQGRLIIRGAGMNKTDLLFTERVDPAKKMQVVDQIEIGGNDASHISFEGFHLGRLVSNPKGPTRSVTQGTVVSVGKEGDSYYVTVDVPPGFPTPADVYDSGEFPISGRFLRRFVYVDGHPEIKDKDEKQCYWQSYEDVSTPDHPSRFKLIIAHAQKMHNHGDEPPKGPVNAPTYQPGDLLGIKAKHGQDSGKFGGASDIVLDHIRWTDSTRVAFVKDSDRISITNCVTDRGDEINGLVPCLACNEGGPQLNPTSKSRSTNIYFANNKSDGQADDAVALFRVNGATVADNVMSDDWARGLNLDGDGHDAATDSKNVTCYGNVINRCLTIPAVLPDVKPSKPTAPTWVEEGCYWDWTQVLGHP
jgi:hypothetical protein